MVQQRLYIVHLMGGDDERSVFRHMLGNDLAELALRRDIQSVGGLVHQQELGIRGEGKRHEHLLLLTHREGIQLHVRRKFKIMKTALQHFHTELGIERAVDLDILAKRHCRQVELLGYDEYLAQHFRFPQLGLDTVEAHTTFLGTKQTANQVEQR